ncbi:hypothetical protein C1646_738888 [Rhizophagus diaphanus]|nr:hypothetical protein C1646_738888 [Rhizophagus diaphanus] [Rhizophagus sp. MUCL 43196]
MQSSPFKRITDARKDLEAYRKNGEKAQEIYDKFILPYRIQNIRLKNQWPTETPMTIRMNGAYYVIANTWDALCVMNEPGESKIEKNDPQEVIRLRGISNWTSEKQIARKLILEPNRDTIPSTLNVSWKLITRQKKIKDKRPDHNVARKWKECKEEKISAGGNFGNRSWAPSKENVSKSKREEADSHISAGDRSPLFPWDRKGKVLPSSTNFRMNSLNAALIKDKNESLI